MPPPTRPGHRRPPASRAHPPPRPPHPRRRAQPQNHHHPRPPGRRDASVHPRRQSGAPMILLFLGLTLANLTCLATAAALGYATPRGASNPWHILAGLLAALLCVAVHCVVSTYFIATAKWVNHAILVRSLDPALAIPTPSFKAMALPAGMLSILSTLLAAALGAITDSYQIDPLWHHLAALLMLAVNLLAAPVELIAIRRNGHLIDRILTLAGTPSAAE